MTDQYIKRSVRILDKVYQVKCPENEEGSLGNAVTELESQLKNLRDNSCVFNLESAAVIISLNLLHELLILKAKQSAEQDTLEQRLSAIQAKIDHALANQEELLLESTLI